MHTCIGVALLITQLSISQWLCFKRYTKGRCLYLEKKDILKVHKYRFDNFGKDPSYPSDEDLGNFLTWSLNGGGDTSLVLYL